MRKRRPAHTTTLTDFVFVRDAFGPIPMWSLQHYEKGYEDGYLVPPELIANQPVLKHKSQQEWVGALRHLGVRHDAMLEQATPYEGVEVFISGVVRWHWQKPYRMIDQLRMTKVRWI